MLAASECHINFSGRWIRLLSWAEARLGFPTLSPVRQFARQVAQQLPSISRTSS